MFYKGKDYRLCNKSGFDCNVLLTWQPIFSRSDPYCHGTVGQNMQTPTEKKLFRFSLNADESQFRKHIHTLILCVCINYISLIRYDQIYSKCIIICTLLQQLWLNLTFTSKSLHTCMTSSCTFLYLDNLQIQCRGACLQLPRAGFLSFSLYGRNTWSRQYRWGMLNNDFSEKQHLSIPQQKCPHRPPLSDWDIYRSQVRILCITMEGVTTSISSITPVTNKHIRRLSVRFG